MRQTDRQTDRQTGTSYSCKGETQTITLKFSSFDLYQRCTMRLLKPEPFQDYITVGHDIFLRPVLFTTDIPSTIVFSTQYNYIFAI